MSKQVLIVDDERLARDRIARFILELGYEFKITMAESGLTALEKIKNCAPDILFLDIQMPGLTGIELLQQIELRPFKVIFQTAFDEYAIQAFTESACDYLLKPFSKERFRIAVEKSLASLHQEQRLCELEESFRKKDGYLERISVRKGDKFHLVNVVDVQCFVSRDHYTSIFTADSEFLCDLSLSYLEKRLDPEKFLRCHRNNIVNLAQVQSVTTGANLILRIGLGLELPVSRQNRQILKEKLKLNPY